MAISKIGSRGVIDGSVLAADFAPGTITNAKLAGSIENSKLSNSTFTIGGESIALGGSDNALNLTDWQSKITSDGSTVTTMVSGRGYFVDNSSAAGLVKLPASASRGDFVQIKDYAGNFGTNNLTIQRNSHNIQGQAVDSTIETNRASVTLVYVDSTKGWLYAGESNIGDLSPFIAATGGTVTTSGNYKIHTFTGDGCFVVSSAGSPGVRGEVSYVVVAGGGSGSGTFRGGGGGAGGFREGKQTCGSYTASPLAASGLSVSAQTYPITIGAGGAGAIVDCGPGGNNGSNSVFSTITSTGGGRGGIYNGQSPSYQPKSNGNLPKGFPGGSGGGGAGYNPSPDNAGGNGNTPPVSPPQGNNGGIGSQSAVQSGGGGGGAGTAGSGGATPGNPGGNGVASSITASPVTRAGGGGGGGYENGGPGTGGSGGGGAGGCGADSAPGSNGTANTGGGGGGAGGGPTNGLGGTGGSGIVIIRYKYQ